MYTCFIYIKLGVHAGILYAYINRTYTSKGIFKEKNNNGKTRVKAREATQHLKEKKNATKNYTELIKNSCSNNVHVKKIKIT